MTKYSVVYLVWLYYFELILGVTLESIFEFQPEMTVILLSHDWLGVMPHYIEKTRNCCYILTLLGTDI